MKRSLLPVTLLALALLSSMNLGRATTYSYTGATATDSWTDAASWYNTTTATTSSGVPTAGDTANVTDTLTANQDLIYNAAASGTLGTLNFTNSTAFSDELDIQRVLGITNAVSLGGANGPVFVVVDEQNINTATLNVAGGTTLNSGAILEIATGGTAANSPGVLGNLTLSGGEINIDAGNFGAGVASSTQTFVQNLTMTSGTLALSTISTVTPAGNASPSNDTRFYINGGFTADGGTILSNTVFTGTQQNSIYLRNQSGMVGTTGSNATTQNNFIGAGVSFVQNGAVLFPNFTLIDDYNGALYSAQQLSNVNLRDNGATNNTVTIILGAATTTAAGVAPTVNPTGTLNVGTIDIQNSSTAGRTEIFQLGSNVTSASNTYGTAYQPTLIGGNIATSTNEIDLNSHTLDITGTSNSGTLNNSGIFSPGISSTLVTGSGDTSSTFNILDSSGAGNGTFKAAGFDLSKTAVDNVQNSVVLQATGAGLANNLGNSGTGTISATSTFLYSPNTTSTTTSTLSATGRSIGILHVTPGAAATSTLQTLTNVTTQGNTQVDANSTLDVAGKTLTVGGVTGLIGAGTVSSSLAGGIVTFTGTGGLQPNVTVGSITPANLTLGSNAGSMTTTLIASSISHFNINSAISFDTLTLGSTATVTYAGTLTLDFTSGYMPTNGQTFTLVNGATTGSDVGGSDFSTINSNVAGDTFTFDGTTGLLTVNAVPEPPAIDLLAATLFLGLGLNAWMRRRGQAALSRI